MRTVPWRTRHNVAVGHANSGAAGAAGAVRAAGTASDAGSAGERLRPTDVGIGQLFDRIHEAVIVADHEGRIVLWNAAAERLFGYRASDAAGQPTDILVPPELRERHHAGWQRYHRAGAGALVDSGHSYELPALHRSGARIRVELTLSSLDLLPDRPGTAPQPLARGSTGSTGNTGTPDSPNGAYVLAIVRDVTARHTAEDALRERAERLRRLHDAALAVAAPVSAAPQARGQLLATIVSQAVAALGGIAGRLVVAEHSSWHDIVPGCVRRDGHVAVRHTGALARERLRRNGDVRHVLATGQALYVDDLDAPSPFGPFPAAKARGVGSFAVVPLRAGGRVLGALTVDFPHPGPLGLEERDTLVLFAGHAAAALERVALLDLERRHAAERAARTAAEQATQRFSFLADASAVLASSLDYQTTLRTVAQLAVPRVADWCIVYLRDLPSQSAGGNGRRAGGNGETGPPAPGAIERVAMAYADPSWAPLAEQIAGQFSIDPDAPTGVPQVLRTGHSIMLRRATTAALTADVDDPTRQAALVAPLQVSSWMCVPLVARGQTLGAISFMAAGGRRFGRADLDLAEAIGRRAALAVDNARLFAAEQAARAAAEAATRARDEFLSIAAHELKTPLTSLRGATRLALRQIERHGHLDANRAEKALRMVDEQSARLVRLTQQLLDVSRLESGRLTLDLQPTDLIALVQRTIHAHGASERHTVTFVAPTAPLQGLVDPLRMEQVLNNLLDNAVRYAPPGSAIDVAVTRLDDRWVSIAVRDRGPGVPPEHRERIFNRFFQVDSRAPPAGLGLGLSICREIVELHGGSITLESPPDGGARFVIVLPLNVATDQ
jgi:PAS domain S-box-containing protein